MVHTNTSNPSNIFCMETPDLAPKSWQGEGRMQIEEARHGIIKNLCAFPLPWRLLCPLFGVLSFELGSHNFGQFPQAAGILNYCPLNRSTKGPGLCMLESLHCVMRTRWIRTSCGQCGMGRANGSMVCVRRTIIGSGLSFGLHFLILSLRLFLDGRTTHTGGFG